MTFYAPPPFEEGQANCFGAVCMSVGQSTNSFCSISSQWLYILNWNLMYRFITMMSRLVWFLIELYLLELKKKNFNFYTVLSWEYLCQVWFSAIFVGYFILLGLTKIPITCICSFCLFSNFISLHLPILYTDHDKGLCTLY